MNSTSAQRALLILIVAAGFSGCRSAPKAAASNAAACRYVETLHGESGSVSVRAEKVVSGLEVPWSIALLPDQKGMLVTERAGRVRLVRDRMLVTTPVATLQVDQTDEAGLLGMALHPRFPSEPWIYFYYTVRKGDQPVNRVQRYRLSADGSAAQSDRIILDDIPAAKYHSGGRIQFGPDGMLYVGTGDSRKPDLSQNRNSLAGKILRVTAEGEVPGNNPWPGNPAYILGVRNTQGFDWLDGSTLIVTDHGPSGELLRAGGDEVSLAKAGDNLGWPTIWGCEERAGMVTPKISWKDATPPGGAAIYTGNEIPEWKGSLIMGTLKSKHLQRMVFGSSGAVIEKNEVYLAGDAPGGLGRIRDVLMGADGQLYVTTSNCDRRGTCPPEKDAIYRIVGGS